jgi:hypothetical protein
MSLTPKLTGVLAALALLASANAVVAQDPWGGAFTERSTFYNPFDASSRFGALGGFDALRSSNPFLDLTPVVVPTGPSVVNNSTGTVTTDASTSGVEPTTTTSVAESVVSSTTAVSTIELSSSSSVMVAPAMSLRPPFQPPVRSPFRPAPRPHLVP